MLDFGGFVKCSCRALKKPIKSTLWRTQLRWRIDLQVQKIFLIRDGNHVFFYHDGTKVNKVARIHTFWWPWFHTRFINRYSILLPSSTHIPKPVRHTSAERWWFMTPATQVHIKVSHKACWPTASCVPCWPVFVRARTLFVKTDGRMRSAFAPVELSSQTGTTQSDKQQMCHTGWNQNSRPAWSCPHHQTWLLLADETRQCLWERTGLFVGRFDTPSHFVISGSCCSSDHMYALAFKECHIRRLTGRRPMRQQPKAMSFSIHCVSTDAQHAKTK